MNHQMIAKWSNRTLLSI